MHAQRQGKVHTVADVHQPEDNDSGHSSYEGAVPSPIDGEPDPDDYLIPISLENRDDYYVNDPSNVRSMTSPSFKSCPVEKSSPLAKASSPLEKPASPFGKSAMSSTAMSPPYTNISQNGPALKSSHLSSPTSSYPEDYRTPAKSGGFIPSTESTTPSSSTTLPSTPNTSTNNTSRTTPSATTATTSSVTNTRLPMPRFSKHPSLDARIPKFHSNTKVYSAGSGAKPTPSLQQPPQQQEPSTPISPAMPASPSTPSQTNSSPLTPNDVRMRPTLTRDGVIPPRFLSITSSGYNSDTSPSELTPPPDYRMGLEDVKESDILV